MLLAQEIDKYFTWRPAAEGEEWRVSAMETGISGLWGGGYSPGDGDLGSSGSHGETTVHTRRVSE